jgi:hypothetical protein
MTPSYQILAGVTNSSHISGLKTTMTVFCNRDSFKITTCANKAGVGNKLVVIFFYRDYFIVNQCFHSSVKSVMPALDK